MYSRLLLFFYAKKDFFDFFYEVEASTGRGDEGGGPFVIKRKENKFRDP